MKYWDIVFYFYKIIVKLKKLYVSFYGRKTVLQWTVIVYSIGTLLCAFSWSFYSLVLFRFITGLGVVENGLLVKFILMKHFLIS